MAKQSKIEINNYFADNKFRITAFSNITVNEVDFNKKIGRLKPIDVIGVQEKLKEIP